LKIVYSGSSSEKLVLIFRGHPHSRRQYKQDAKSKTLKDRIIKANLS